jgi:hypothetical protein
VRRAQARAHRGLTCLLELEEMAAIRGDLERRMAEQLRHLDESRESFTRLCERLPVGIHRSDPEGHLTW